jgi:hypothetical protein
MGRKQERRQTFLQQHPVCCFCGGSQRATTEDHFPPRAIFHDRQWPEGYVFPACASCNAATAKHELLVSMLARLGSNARATTHYDELKQLVQAVANNFPGILESMRMSLSEKRAWLRDNSGRLAQGSTSADIGLESASDPRIEEAVEQFGRKLFLALFYYHTQKIVPNRGGIVFRWTTNGSDLDEVFPRNVLQPLLSGFPSLLRTKTTLDDQFFYRYAIAEASEAAVFLTLFNDTLAMLGFVFCDSATAVVPQDYVLLAPFQHRH